MHNLVVLIQSVRYQFISYIRIKEAVFFGTVFPVFLFVVFSSIWGAGNDDYALFLLSGVIGMTIASDGIFAIGPVIRNYYGRGLVRYFKKLPSSIFPLFLGLIISRVVSLIFTVLVVCLVAYFIFGIETTLKDFGYYALSVLIGLSSFAFIGLALSFAGMKGGAGKGFGNMIYFTILFTSVAFYPVKSLNMTVGMIGDLLPLNPILNLLRQQEVNYWVLLFWVVFPAVLFFVLFKRIRFKR